MDAKTIESQYNKILAFNYSNVEMLIEQLNKSLALYKKAKNQSHPKIKYRIKLYTKIIDYAKNNK